MLYLTRKCLQKICQQDPNATAMIRGSQEYPQISGRVSFYDLRDGCVVMAEIVGLPDRNLPDCYETCAGMCSRFFGLHIHGGSSCSGNTSDPFADAGAHDNPSMTEHPYHAGDLPVLLSNCGYAWMSCYTERFLSSDIMGKTVIIHDMPDDFRTQPAGASGKRIACGKILA